MRLLIPAAAVFVALGLPGCEAGYSEFYRSAPAESVQRVLENRANAPPKVPTVDHAATGGSELVDAYARHGYAFVGYASFNSGRRQSESDAVSQGEKVQADVVVIVDPRYAGSRTSVVPITTPTTQTTYTNGTATMVGPAGTATADETQPVQPMVRKQTSCRSP